MKILLEEYGGYIVITIFGITIVMGLGWFFNGLLTGEIGNVESVVMRWLLS